MNWLVIACFQGLYTECPAEQLGEAADSPLPQGLMGAEALTHNSRGGDILTVGRF